MALDYYHLGGRALVNISLASMNPAPAAGPASLAAMPGIQMCWGDLLETIDELWAQYEVFVTTCEDIALPTWVERNGIMVPRTLETRRDVSFRYADHRAHYRA
jgi:hypothetical protein